MGLEHLGQEKSGAPGVRTGGLARELAVIVVFLLFAMFSISRALADDPLRATPDNIWPKIPRLTGDTLQEQTPPASPDTAAVSQRVVLYEGQEPKQYVGRLIWRTVTAASEPGQPTDVGIRAEVEIPERRLRMNFTLRRNLDPSLPASHIIEIEFSTPADFPPGGIADVPVVVMEDTDKTLGPALNGLRVKVGAGFFLIGLSSHEADQKRNRQLLRDRRWLQIPIVYNDQQRALLALEKGPAGEHVFAEAFRAWDEPPTAAR